MHAGLMRAVRDRALQADAVQRALDDGVRFGVHRAQAVAVDDRAADVRTVRDAARRAVIAGGQDAMVAHEHAADGRARTGRARRDGPRDFHEVFVPTRTHGRAQPLGRTMTGTELVLPNMRSPASPSPGTI